jgi:hypothetical protein
MIKKIHFYNGIREEFPSVTIRSIFGYQPPPRHGTRPTMFHYKTSGNFILQDGRLCSFTRSPDKSFITLKIESVPEQIIHISQIKRLKGITPKFICPSCKIVTHKLFLRLNKFDCHSCHKLLPIAKAIRRFTSLIKEEHLLIAQSSFMQYKIEARKGRTPLHLQPQYKRHQRRIKDIRRILLKRIEKGSHH